MRVTVRKYGWHNWQAIASCRRCRYWCTANALTRRGAVEKATLRFDARHGDC